MNNEQKPGDPADKAADGAFGGVQSHRAGYGDDLLERLIEYLRLRPTATLASGEGGMLVQHILLLRARIEGMTEAGKVYEKLYSDARDEIDRLTRILAALREPSKEVFGAALRAYSESLSVTHKPRFISAILAAVAAAEKEVGG